MDSKENTQATQLSETKIRRGWKESVVVLLVLPIILFILLPLGGLFYLSGRFWPEAIYFVVLSLVPYCIFTIVCFFVCTSRLRRHWKQLTDKKRLIIAAELAIPLVLIASFVACLIEPQMAWPGSKLFMYGFAERISARADVDSIRAWLRTFSKEDGVDYPAALRPDGWTEPLKELNPRRVYYSRDQNGSCRVKLQWGGGIVSWGVEIGMKDMKIPASDPRLHGESKRFFKPGFYVWFRVQ